MKSVLIFCLSIVLITACSKEKSFEGGNEKGENYIKFKVDGNTTEFNEFVFATKSNIGNQYYVVVQGHGSASSDAPGLGIFIQDSVEITEGTYAGDDLSSGNALLYTDPDSTNFSSLFMTEPSGLNIVITNIDSATIRGTFSSKVADLSANTRSITEGEFFARFQ